jgi:hypothetical protein
LLQNESSLRLFKKADINIPLYSLPEFTSGTGLNPINHTQTIDDGEIKVETSQGEGSIFFNSITCWVINKIQEQIIQIPA